MLIPRFLMRHQVTVEAFLGDTSTGPKYGPPVVIEKCFVDEQTRGVRTPGGEQVTSTSTVYADRGTAAPQFSRVTLPSGRVTKVIQTKDRDGAGLPTPDHVEIQLE